MDSSLMFQLMSKKWVKNKILLKKDMELNSERHFKYIDDVCVNEHLFKCAVAGEQLIKIFNMTDWAEIPEERITLPRNAGKVNKIVKEN